MQEIFEIFMEKYQGERNPARNTVLLIRSIIPRFLEFCRGRGRGDLKQINREDVINYLNSLNGSRTSTKKVHKAIITLYLNACYSYGLRAEKMETITFKGPSDVPRAPLKGFTGEELIIMRRNVGRLGIRERIIFNLISNRPLRISEFVNLTVGDVDLEAKNFTIFRSKNTKTRVLGIPKEALKDLEEYIKPEWPTDQNLFGLHIRGMEFSVKEVIKKLRVNPNGRNSHAFRHTVIMRLLRNAQIDPAVVAQLAGNTPKTIYSNYAGQVTIDEQRRAERAFDRIQKKDACAKKEFKL